MAGGGEDSFIQPLGLLLGLTAVLALLLSYIGQSTIIAFIAVGVIVSALGVEPETTTLGHISEVGILILLFMAGLEVDLGAFLKNWRTAAIVGIGQIVCSTGFFAATALFVLPAIGAEVTTDAAVYFGLCLCFSSTILVLGYLKSSKSMGTLYGQLCLGTLVLQDAASVLGIAVLSGLGAKAGSCKQADVVDCPSAYDAGACEDLGPACYYSADDLFGRLLANGGGTASSSLTGCVDACAGLEVDSCGALSSCAFEDGGGGGVAASILILFGKLVAVIVICFVLNRYVLHRMFEEFARSLELLYLGSLGYATGLAAIAVTAGFSGEITAFLAGVSISQLPYKMHIETKMEPIKSLGVAIFFITLGLQLELGREMVDSLPIGFGLALFTLFATLPLFMMLGYLARLKSHTVFMLGLLMNQISEFSLILCTLCVRAGVFEKVVLTVMTVAAVVSIVVSSVGHAYIDAIYKRMQRCRCLRRIDSHRHRGLRTETRDQPKRAATDKSSWFSWFAVPSKSAETEEETEAVAEEGLMISVAHAEEAAERGERRLQRTLSPLRGPPPGPGAAEDWSRFEDRLKNRSTMQLEIDLKETEKELEQARESMAATADEKRLLHPDKRAKKMQLYGLSASTRRVKGPESLTSIIKTSHATDIMHGMIEGYVVVDHQLTFCTLRAGRMLFWGDQHDVGHAPPTSVWDVSGMALLKTGGKGANKESEDAGERTISAGDSSDSDVDVDGEGRPWEWTVVLGHIHRHTGTSSIEDDSMKLAIHGLKDHSDHDAQDWRDALAVATSTLNPIALRLAHIREELHERRSGDAEGKTPEPSPSSLESQAASHGHRNEIVCIGYNEMFPAVLALADAVGKGVVMVEYDPVKLNTIEELYSEERRRRDFRDGKKRKGGNLREAYTTDDIGGAGSLERGGRPHRPRRVRTVSMPAHIVGGGGGRGFWASHSTSLDESDRGGEEGGLRGVKCEYADIHDPECWEELEMDKAFMLVCTMKGARHAEKAILRWLRRQSSDAIFVACSQNNVEAVQMYRAGAHFVMQTDALAARSTREIFLETVASVGDCSQLVAAGRAHQKRLLRLEEEDGLKFQYETG